MNAAQDRRAAEVRRRDEEAVAASRIQGAVRAQDERWWTEGEMYENNEEAAWAVQGAMRGRVARDSVEAQRLQEERLPQEAC